MAVRSRLQKKDITPQDINLAFPTVRARACNFCHASISSSTLICPINHVM